jgi:hypothetical protein
MKHLLLVVMSSDCVKSSYLAVSLSAGSYLFYSPRTLEHLSDMSYHQLKYARQIICFRNHEFTLVTCDWELPVELMQLEIEARLSSLFNLFVCFWRDSPPVGQGLLIHEFSRSHTKTHHIR